MPEEKKDWKKLLSESRRLEKEALIPNDELVRMQKETVAEAIKLRKMLAEQWFVKDLDVKKTTAKKK